MNVEGSVVLVTGSNRGIGRAIVDAFLRAGAALVYAGMRKPEPLGLARVESVPLDVTDRNAVRALAERLSNVLIVVNNAGVLLGQPLLATEHPDAAERELQVNYLGTLHVTRAFAPVLKRNGGGAIVNVASILGRVNLPSVGSYSASKAALYSLTQGVRAELSDQGTLVVGVFPAFVDTDMARGVSAPKLTPQQVADEVVQAVQTSVEDVYPGPAVQIEQQLRADPKAVEAQFAAMYRARAR